MYRQFISPMGISVQAYIDAAAVTVIECVLQRVRDKFINDQAARYGSIYIETNIVNIYLG